MDRGDVKINGKYYRINTPSYRSKDVTDFSPKATAAGGAVVHSELMLYQPYLQNDWRHGFGGIWYEDAMRYMYTNGNVDTRHPGIAMMFTKSTLSESTAGEGSNLITNGNLELGALTNWTQTGTTGAAYSAGTTSPYDGSYCLECAAVTNSGSELLTNGDAELGAFTNWTKTAESAGAWTCVTATPAPQAGTYCFKWKPTNATNSGVLTSDRITVTAGSDYLVSGYIYTLAIPDHAKIEVKWYDDASAGTLLRTDIVGTTSEVQAFKKYDNTLTAPLTSVSAAVVVTVTNLSTTTNYAAVDSLSFTLASSETVTSDRYAAVGNKSYELVLYSKDGTSSTTETLQPADSDTYISNTAPSTNYGSNTALSIGKTAAGSINRALVKFLGLSNGTIPSKATLDSATLSLMVLADNAANGANFGIYRMLKAWTGDVASWVAYKTGSYWSSYGAFYSADCNTTALATSALTQSETLDSWINWSLDLTELTKIVDRTNYNYGFLMKSVSENSDNYTFYSSDHATTANRPKLVVVYTTVPDYDVKVNWYDAASSGNLIRSDTLLSENKTATWTRRAARIMSPVNALSFTISVVATQGAAFYLDNIDFHLADGNKQGFCNWNNATWAWGVAGLSKYTAGTWTSVYATTTVNCAFPAGDYLFFCPDGARIQKINTSGTISDAGNDSNSIDYKWILAHNGFIYVGVDGTNRVHSDSSEDLSDLEGTTADPDCIYVGTSSSPTIGAIVYMSRLFIAKEDGLWEIGEDKIARRLLDFSSEADSTNFRSTAVHNGYLLFPIRDKIYQWNGARMSDVTPPRLSDTFPYTTYGRFDNFVASGRFLYCTARTNETTYAEDLLCFDGVAWVKLMNILANGSDTVTAMGYDSLNNYLWYNIDSDTNTTYYIPFQSQSELPYADFPTSGSHELVSSRLDMGFRWVQKSAPSLIIEASNVTSDRYLSIYYSIDGGEWVEWDSVKTEGNSELNIPGGSQSVEFNYMQIKVRFVTNDATESPILEGITLRFLMRPDELYATSFSIPLAQGSDVGMLSEDRTAATMWKDLKDARASKSPIEFIDIDGSEYFVYLTSLTKQLIEFNREGMGNTPGMELSAQVNIIEAK